MQFFAKTDQGKMRKMNQDIVFATKESIGIFPNLFLLADGMGGHKAGDYASRYLVEGLASYLKEASGSSPIHCLGENIKKINAELFSLSENNIHLRGMGSTIVTAFVEDKILFLSNVGDSRAYIFRRNRLKQLTKDHSYVEEKIRMGEMIRGSKDYLSHKNYITRAVGAEKNLQVDFFETDLEEGDLFFLCSDGLSNMVDNESIAQILKDESGIEEKGQALIDLANINGGKDNIALILVNPFGKE